MFIHAGLLRSLCVVGRYDEVRITNTGTKTVSVVNPHYLEKHSQVDITKLFMMKTAWIILT